MNISTYIIIFTCIFSISAINNHSIFNKFQFNPYQTKEKKEWYRFLSHAFLHADYMHLLVNMFVLFFFGRNVELYFNHFFAEKGIFYFIGLYIGGILFSVLPTYQKHQNDSWYNSVGASGAVSAIVFSSIIFDPFNKICLYGLLCFPGILWGIFYLGYSYYMGKKGGDNINHDAHLGGAIFGVLFTLAAKPQLALDFLNQIITLFN